mmetsp:Transcript_96832/g.172310  ORF Transcript_96832/g.172310 Transcript_96832/m.172310 type:complete len:204 (+) Transcript_96832:99-710(+)
MVSTQPGRAAFTRFVCRSSMTSKRSSPKSSSSCSKQRATSFQESSSVKPTSTKLALGSIMSLGTPSHPATRVRTVSKVCGVAVAAVFCCSCFICSAFTFKPPRSFSRTANLRSSRFFAVHSAARSSKDMSNALPFTPFQYSTAAALRPASIAEVLSSSDLPKSTFHSSKSSVSISWKKSRPRRSHQSSVTVLPLSLRSTVACC